MDLTAQLQRRHRACTMGDMATKADAERVIAALGFHVVDTPQGPSLMPIALQQPMMAMGTMPEPVATGRGRGRGRGRGAAGAAGAVAATADAVPGRGRGRGTSTSTASAIAAAPPARAAPVYAHPDVYDDYGDDDYGDGGDGDEDDMGELAEAMANEWATFDEDGNGMPPPGRDWGTRTGDRPDLYTNREADYEAMGRPADHQYGGAEELWKAPTNGEGVAGRDLPLEQRLFATGQGTQGINFDRYADIPVQVTGNNPPPPSSRFDEMPLEPVLQFNVQLAKFKTPTPVQKQAIPIVLAGRDLMACAQTGSGKTAAFILPTVSGVLKNPEALKKPSSGATDGHRGKVHPKILVLAPTRELACQIYDDACKFAYRTAIRPVVVYGGADTNYQIQKVRAGCELLVATPGRLIDFMERHMIALSDVQYLVLDEADRMLDMGFEPQIRRIVQQSDMVPSNIRQTLMFSATFPYDIQRLARDFLRPDYLFLTVGRVGAASENITQEVLYVEDNEKTSRLLDILRSLTFPPSRVLIFVNMKRTADIIEGDLRRSNFPASAIHGDMLQWEREMSLNAFKDGSRPILAATDVAARGLDIPHVTHVINYDMSQNIDDHVHRIGRTGRAGHTGTAITFFNRSNTPIARDLVRMLEENKQVVPKWLPPLQYVRREGGSDSAWSRHRSRTDTYGGHDMRFAPEPSTAPIEPKEGMNPAVWDQVMTAKQRTATAATGAAAAPVKKVYASVAVVDTRVKPPEWMDDDDDDGLAWGNDRMPSTMPRNSNSSSSTGGDGGGDGGGSVSSRSGRSSRGPPAARRHRR